MPKKRGQNEGTIFDERPGPMDSADHHGIRDTGGKRRRVRKKFVAASRAAVHKKLTTAMGQQQHGRNVSPRVQTLAHFLDAWDAIITFLGYNPLPAADTVAERLVRHRISLGLSQEESAKRLDVDPCTLAPWERGEREPTGGFLARVKRFLSEREAGRSKFRRIE